MIIGSGDAMAQNCQNVLGESVSTHGQDARVRPEDLVGLRDIGSIPDMSDAPTVALSPDGKLLAFQLRRADPQANDYCLVMVVQPVSARGRQVIVDTGGTLILWTGDVLGKADFASGIAKVITPRWSPDGTWIAFLKRVGSITQVWRANVDGSGSSQLTHSAVDVARFEIVSGGKTLVYSSRPRLAAETEAIEKEGATGYLYDDRFSPVAANRPIPLPVPMTITALNLADGTSRDATDAETKSLDGGSGNAPPGSIAIAVSRSGRKAWTIAGDEVLAKARLFAETGGHHRVECSDPRCVDVDFIWWVPDSSKVRFNRREGPSRSVTAFYEWTPGPKKPRRLYQSEDLFLDCQALGGDLICLREASLRPRYIAKLDPRTGNEEVLFEPNRDFASLPLGRVERIHWKNAFGIETFGDLVYPVDYQAGRQYPLVVVQYQSRGFLRGGTGDDYPIQPFASRGYAVLSFQRPLATGYQGKPKTYAEVDRKSLVDFADRKSVLSSVETGVRILVERGIADPRRVGITGLSDGASTVQFAALNSTMFRAAAMSTCCWEKSQAAVLGPNITRMYRDFGWPSLNDDRPEFWEQISLAQNAKRVAFPILMQVSDNEYLAALEGYTALKEAGMPVEMIVFPGEYHLKWQPAHRLAAYRRSIAWFDYWLRGITPEASMLPIEARRWATMAAGPLGHSIPEPKPMVP